MSSQMESHPLIAWINGLIVRGGAKYENGDLYLTPLAARRFALSLHEKNPVLCWSDTDNKALGGIRWKSAAIVFGLKNHDWIALNCPDIRIKNSGALNPVKLRVFIPVSAGRLDPWKEVMPPKLGISIFSMEKGRPVLTSRPAFTLPVKLMG